MNPIQKRDLLRKRYELTLKSAQRLRIELLPSGLTRKLMVRSLRWRFDKSSRKWVTHNPLRSA